MTNSVNREEEILSEFVNLAIKRFKWTNLPLGLTSDRLEEMLINHGELGGTLHDGNLIILPIHGVSKVNVYNEFVEYRMTGYNGFNLQLSVDDLCRLKNNPTSSADIDTLRIFAKRISDIERTQEVNLFQMNIPKQQRL